MNTPVILDLVQGSVAWHAHRATALNASDAPAMMGASKHLSRTNLIRQRATGLVPDVDEAMQCLFDRGHAAEAATRPAIEDQLGEELYPVTVTRYVEGLALSASLDGQTMDGATIWEHKLWSEALAAQVRAGELEPHYYWQLEQQLLVSGAELVIFTTSDGAERRESMEYRTVPGRAEQLIAGWRQFCADAAAEPAKGAPVAMPVAAPVEGFGALSLRIEGRVLASNLDAFKAGADAFIARLPKPADLQSDQDFADADAAVKACAEAEARIKSAKDSAQAQMADVDAAFRLADVVSETIRSARLALDKAVKSEKDRRKSEIVAAGVDAVRAHYATINATLGEHKILAPQSLSLDIGGAIKGLRTLASITDAVDTAAASAKIAASQRADSVRACVAVLTDLGEGYESLFADRVALCATKSPDDLRNLIAARIAEHEKREATRLEQERERIRAEGEAKARAAAPMHSHSPGKGEPGYRAPMPAGEVFEAITEAGPIDSGQRIKLGDINARIAPLSITADGLAQLGFSSVGTERAAKLYAASDFPAICDALISRIAAAAQSPIARAA